MYRTVKNTNKQKTIVFYILTLPVSIECTFSYITLFPNFIKFTEIMTVLKMYLNKHFPLIHAYHIMTYKT